MSEAQKSDEFWEGYYAWGDGLTDADCPYDIGTMEAMDWIDGLMCAESEDEV